MLPCHTHTHTPLYALPPRTDRLVEAHPAMLDVDGLRAAIAEARRIMPGLDVAKQMGSDPSVRQGGVDGQGCGTALPLAAPPRVRSNPECPALLPSRAVPQIIFSFQVGNQLIPYDPPRPLQPDEDEYGAYYGPGV